MSRNVTAVILGSTALALTAAIWFGPGDAQARLQAMGIPAGAITAAFALVQQEES